MPRSHRIISILFVASLALVLISIGTQAQRAQASPQSYPAGISLSVNSSADTNTRDSVLTLREAILIARGDLATSSGICITDAEYNRIFGGTWTTNPDCNYLTSGGGPLYGDDIFFDSGTSTVTVAAALPAIDCGDNLQSDAFDQTRRVTIDGTSAGY